MEKKENTLDVSERKVLVVDDDPVALGMLERIFLAEGYWVAKAVNGKEAIIIADEFLPHVIILDIMMPVMDGTEAYQRLQKNPRTKKIPVLFLTSIISKKEELGRFAKKRCFLAKPVDKEKLLTEVEKCFDKLKEKSL